MKNKIGIIIVVLLLVILSVEGYFCYKSYKNTQKNASYMSPNVETKEEEVQEEKNIPEALEKEENTEVVNEKEEEKQPTEQIKLTNVSLYENGNEKYSLVIFNNDYTAQEIFTGYDNIYYIGEYDNKAFITYAKESYVKDDIYYLQPTYFAYLDLNSYELTTLFEFPKAKYITDCNYEDTAYKACYGYLNVDNYILKDNKLTFTLNYFNEDESMQNYLYRIYNFDLTNLKISSLNDISYTTFKSYKDYELVHYDLVNNYKYYSTYQDTIHYTYMYKDEKDWKIQLLDCDSYDFTILSQEYSEFFVCNKVYYNQYDVTILVGDNYFKNLEIKDWFIYENKIYYLTTDGEIYTIDNLGNQTKIASNLPSNLSEIYSRGGIIYGYILAKDTSDNYYYIKDGKIYDYYDLTITITSTDKKSYQVMAKNIYFW